MSLSDGSCSVVDKSVEDVESTYDHIRESRHRVHPM